MRWTARFYVLTLLAGFLQANDLSVSDIMRGEDFVGVSPSRVRWRGDGERIFFRWREPGREEDATYSVHCDGSGLERLSEEEEEQAWPRFGVWDEQRQRFLSVVDGDIYLYRPDGARQALVETRERESGPSFGAGGETVFFVRGNNVFELSLREGLLRQVTDFREGDKPEEEEPSGNRAFLREQQEELFEEFSGDKKKEREKREKEREEADKRAFYIGSGASLSDQAPSPDGRYVAFRWNRPSKKRTATLVPDYVTEDGFTADLKARPKVGDPQGESKTGIYDAETGEVHWIEAVENGALVVGPKWARDGSRAALYAISSDFKERLLLSVDPASGESAEADRLRDEAWIGGPAYLSFGWLPGGDRLYFVSEQDGWAHLYTVAADGSQRRQETSGGWEVTGVQVAPGEKHFLLTASREDLGQRHLYRLPLEGGQLVRLTRGEGRFDANVSPGGGKLALRFSSSNRPPELYCQAARPGAEMRKLTDSTLPGFDSYRWRKPEIVQVPARDGARVAARLYRPKKPAAGRPAVIFVHGAGYLQNAHRWWSSYYREYMFHNLLADRGYHVLDMDYRGSAGYGRDWRTGIYRHMGGLDLSDQVDGARWLASEHGVDPGRIGIYGGSYGGFITLMAMFTEPGVFAAGAALRPVTDWAHYNNFYTGRILNLPQDDPEAYQRSSPIYFAQGLEGALLICHGMVDTNVHFQDTVRLAQRLIELGKENWEVAIYPVEGHGFENASSWADEYKRIYRLFERHLKREPLDAD